MDNSVRGHRCRGLTCETSNALHRTLLGIVDLIKTMLYQGYEYVLPGKLSSDRAEGEFGIYRQSGGGNFLISAEQVFSGLQLQRLKLFSKLDIHTEDNDIDNDCCRLDLQDSEEDLDLIEKCFEEASNLNSNEKSTLYYICGYVAKKEGIVRSDEEYVSLSECEFTVELSRGELSLPPLNLYDLSLYYYAFFKSRNVKCCTKIFLEAFNEIHKFTGYDFPNINRINRRLCNCFFKAFVKNVSDQINLQKQKDQRDTKRRRISSRY